MTTSNETTEKKTKYGKYESQGLGTKLESLKSEENELKSQLDNTVLKVILNKPLLPGQFDEL